MILISDEALAAVTIRSEAEGEPYDGKVAVGEVIRNRMKHRFFSDGSVPGTVCRSYQFSAWNDDGNNNKLLIRVLKSDDSEAVVKECVQAWRDSELTNLVKGALFYMNVALVRSWNHGHLPKWWDIDATPVGEVVIGHHTFRRKR